ncbi:MAG: MarR family transcriptional regulator [Chloroflexi bacterium]|nr:MarR family transcriptional regulator [Chloroflexota bacterium]
MGENEKLYNLLKETFILLDDGDRRLFGNFKLTPPRFYALSHIAEEPGLSSSRLSDRLLCDKSNVTRIVKGLESDEYIERKPHETDGRALRLYLTEKGTAVLQKVQAAHTTYNANRLTALEGVTHDTLVRYLTQLNQSLLTVLSDQKNNQSANGSNA